MNSSVKKQKEMKCNYGLDREVKTNFRTHKQEPKLEHKQKCKKIGGCKTLTIEEKQQVEYALHFLHALINDFPHSNSPNPYQFSCMI